MRFDAVLHCFHAVFCSYSAVFMLKSMDIVGGRARVQEPAQPAGGYRQGSKGSSGVYSGSNHRSDGRGGAPGQCLRMEESFHDLRLKPGGKEIHRV